MSDNLALWKSVERTDPSAVKEITGKSYKGNSPKPHYIIHRATETFGPIGIGWGFKVLEERVEDGALLAPGFCERHHIARVLVWFKWQGERGEVEHIGQTAFSGQRSSGKPFVDEDACKKSVTDALIKALSLIGFAGDIFMGRFDDSKYVAEVREEFQEQRREEKRQSEPPRVGTPANVTAYVAECERAVAAITDPDALAQWWKEQDFPMGKLGIESGGDVWGKLRDGYARRYRELKPKPNAVAA